MSYDETKDYDLEKHEAEEAARLEEEEKMEIKNEKPPADIWDAAHKQFKIDDSATVYTVGKIIYNPAGVDIDDFLFEHETTHAQRQGEYEGGPEAWWKRYFEDAAFRTEEELIAYGEQYGMFCALRHDRNMQARYLHEIAKDMSGGMYGGVVSHVEAMQRIKAAA